MLSAIPKRWFSWDFTIQDRDGQTVGEVVLSNRERGTILAGGVERKVSRESALGAFVLEEGGSIVAKAVKPSAFKRAFTIEHAGRQYTLKPRSGWRREMVLHEGDREIGAVIPEKILARRARVELTDDLPIALRLFVIWLTLLLWKRASDQAAASGGA
jgi:hypothetical protein